MTVHGKRVLVMGAARPTGVGRALVERLARAGARLVISDTPAGAADDGSGGTGRVDGAYLDRIAAEAARLAGTSVPVIPVDPLDDASVGHLMDEAARQLGGLDAVCNNVGATGPALGDGPLAEVSPAAWAAGLAWNATTAWSIARRAAFVMAPGGGGSIVMMSSYAGIAPTPAAGVVGVARAAVNHLVRLLALELGPSNIRVNAVCPLGVSVDPGAPGVHNPGLARLAADSGMSLDAWLASRIPMGRGQTPDEAAAVFEFLVSDASSFVSGAAVPVAGGAAA